MNTKETNPANQILNPSRFTSRISRSEEFLNAFPHQDHSELEPSEKSRILQRAIGKGALHVAESLEAQGNEQELDAHLFRLVGSLSSSFENFKASEGYKAAGRLSNTDRETFRRSKDNLIEFNEILREIINTGASKFSFNELVNFMTTMHAKSGGHKELGNFREFAQASLVGMCDEVAFEQMLINEGIDYKRGNDAEGEDFTIYDKSFDLKANDLTARNAKLKAIREGRDPRRIIWSHIDPEAYQGRLTLPYEALAPTFAKVLPDLMELIPELANRKAA